MKTLMVAVLAVAAVGANVAFAEEDDGIVSAAPAIADPINPQPGMLFNGYALKNHGGRNFSTLPESLKTAPSVKTAVTTADKLAFNIYRDVEIMQGKWEGFLKCKLPKEYTFVVQQTRTVNAGYYLYVNGAKVLSGEGQTSANVKLKVGFNKIVVIAQGQKYPVSISYRPAGSMDDPRPLTPAMMFYDKPVKEDW